MDSTLTIIPFNSRYFHQIGKFGIIFDMRPCEIDDFMVLSRQRASERKREKERERKRERNRGEREASFLSFFI